MALEIQSAGYLPIHAYIVDTFVNLTFVFNKRVKLRILNTTVQYFIFIL